MGKKFEGKTLLMLGSNVGAAGMIRYAKENGAYTIAADYYEAARSEAKRAADEAVLISTADVEALINLVRERKVDGVLAGVSEFNLLKAMEVSKACGLKFYCTREQWEQVEHKEQFRELCHRNAVPCPKTYFVGSALDDKQIASFSYPLVVKPVDASTSAGVYICTSAEELAANWKLSLAASTKGTLIVEEFVSGNEFTAHYTICGGNATLSCVDNRYPVAVHAGRVTTVPAGRIYPSVFTKEYIQSVNPSMLRLCECLGIKDGVLFVQGIHNPDSGKFWIFEAGLRSAGEAPSRFLAQVNGVDYMHVLVDHALLGYAEFAKEREDPFLGGKCCGIVSFVARGGQVGQINGLEEAVAAVPSVVDYESRYPVGSRTPDGDTLRQLMIRFVMVCDSRQQMARDVDYLNHHVTVLDTEGRDMVLKLEADRIFSEF